MGLVFHSSERKENYLKGISPLSLINSLRTVGRRGSHFIAPENIKFLQSLGYNVRETVNIRKTPLRQYDR
jgi:hypothetical protein